MTSTGSSLFDLLDDPDDDRKQHRFVERYRPRVVGYCRRCGLNSADAEDISQKVLVRMLGRLATFQYDATRSFRAYIHTAAYHAVCDEFKKRKGRWTNASGGSSHLARLHQLADKDSRRDSSDTTADRVAARVEALLGSELWREAEQEIQHTIPVSWWQCYLAWKQKKAHEARDSYAKRMGRKLKISENAVHQRACRVRQAIKEVLQNRATRRQEQED